jgi:ribosomal protein L11 methyltransferase
MGGWLELAITLPAEAADALGHHLMGIGAPGVIEEQVDCVPSRLRLRAHFPATRERDPLVQEVRSFLGSLDDIFPGAGAAILSVSSVVEEDWAEGWKQRFPPVEIGESLRIRTPWSPADPRRHDVEILPAMAFGTGQHASTLGCLLALETLALEGGDLSAVLDVGTGSGILGIAAARLGAERVLALDDDPVAVAAAVENVRRNALERRVEVREATVESVRETFSLVVANLYTNLLRSLCPAFARVSRPGGLLVVSGLLDEDRAAVCRAAEEVGWRERNARSVDGWTTLVFVNAR